MVKDGLFINDEMLSFIKKNDFGSAAKILFKHQKNEWALLSSGYKSLETIETKTFQFSGYKIKIQFNPARIISSAAKVDPESIKERKCFLCLENLPADQKGILYKNKYLILCNPFPIFPEHFTIPHKEHIPQKISANFKDLLHLSRDISKYYTLLYNGPKCGASAPDHFHFQAGNKFFMPLDNEFHQIKNEYGEALVEKENLIIYGIDDGLRRFISIESKDEKIIKKTFDIFYELYNSISIDEEEPMMNIHSFYEEESGWRLSIFLREKHRSSHYFAEGENNILISAASVDMGGVCITPLEKDFEKISPENIIEIFNEIIINKERFIYIKAALKKK